MKRIDWYMVAYCEKSKAIRTFKCERITQIEIYEEQFTVPKDFKIDEYWNRSEKNFKSSCSEKEQFPVVIKVYKTNRHIIKDIEILKLWKNGDFIIAKVNFYIQEFAIESIMKSIKEIEVISPLEIRNSIKENLMEILESYSD